MRGHKDGSHRKPRKTKLPRTSGEFVVTDTQARLEAMSLAECIAAVAVDVASKRDEYRSIDPHELAALARPKRFELPTPRFVVWCFHRSARGETSGLNY